jgi:hypothetical protein
MADFPGTFLRFQDANVVLWKWDPRHYPTNLTYLSLNCNMLSSVSAHRNLSYGAEFGKIHVILG